MVTTAREMGMALRRLREDAGWSRDVLAQRAGVSKRWLASFETGKPSVELSKVMDCFAVLGAGLDVVVTSDQSEESA